MHGANLQSTAVEARKLAVAAKFAKIANSRFPSRWRYRDLASVFLVASFSLDLLAQSNQLMETKVEVLSQPRDTMRLGLGTLKADNAVLHPVDIIQQQVGSRLSRLACFPIAVP